MQSHRSGAKGAQSDKKEGKRDHNKEKGKHFTYVMWHLSVKYDISKKELKLEHLFICWVFIVAWKKMGVWYQNALEFVMSAKKESHFRIKSSCYILTKDWI